jgi:adenosine kinase
MSQFKIAVLGPIPRDRIITPSKEVIEKYGCVTHTVIALSNLTGSHGTVYPVTHVQKTDKEAVKTIFQKFDNIDTSHIRSYADQGDVITLTFLNQNVRKERQTAFMNPIVEKDVADVLDCDAFVMVPVTDFEVPLATLKYIKEQNSKALIVFDAHGPTSCLTVKGKRHMKVWVNRDSWLPYIDVLKMNLEEAHCCWFENDFYTKDFYTYDDDCKEQLPKFAQHCIDMGVKAVYITLDSRGVLVFYMKNGELQQEIVGRIKVDNVVDTTGCGDSFAAGLGYSVVAHPGDYIKAAQFGNAMGAQRTQGRTFEVFQSIEETEKMISENYNS